MHGDKATRQGHSATSSVHMTLHMDIGLAHEQDTPSGFNVWL